MPSMTVETRTPRRTANLANVWPNASLKRNTRAPASQRIGIQRDNAVPMLVLSRAGDCTASTTIRTVPGTGIGVARVPSAMVSVINNTARMAVA